MTGQRVTVLMGETAEQRDARYADAGMRYLMSRPVPDRIALARELLVGTGYMAAKPPRAMGSRRTPEYAQGWNECRQMVIGSQADDNACRAAMMATDGR